MICLIPRIPIFIEYLLVDIQVGRAGRFGTKGLGITFCANEEDETKLKEIQDRFLVKIKPLPDTIESSTYSNFFGNLVNN